MGKRTGKRTDRREDCNVRRRRWTRRRCVDLRKIRPQTKSDVVIPLDTSTDMFAVRNIKSTRISILSITRTDR